MNRAVLIMAAMLLLGLFLSCSTQNVGTLGPDDIAKETLANGKPFGNVHELHAGPDEEGNRFAECLDCHQTHGMTFDWQNVDREYCLACHTDKANHHKNQDCMQCHNTSGGPGG